MPDKKTGTLLTHVSSNPEKYDGAVNIPVHRTSTIVFKTLEDFDNRHNAPYIYGRNGTPTSAAFEQAIAALEGAAGAVSTCSGLSAIVVSLMAFAKAGDHVLMVDNVYGPSRKFCVDLLEKYGVECDFYPPMIGAGIQKMFKKNTRVLFMEAPGSFTFETGDIGALVSAAKAKNIITVMDNSWATPLLFKPLAHGIDVSVMAATKYISGHSDTLLGVVSGNAAVWPALRATALCLGLCAGSEELYMGLRGLRTLEVRLKEHQSRALDLAHWLEKQPAVKRVLHPALSQCPGHDNWKKYFKGASGTFGIILKESDKKKIAPMLDGFKLFHIGASWADMNPFASPYSPSPTAPPRPGTRTDSSCAFTSALRIWMI